MRTKYLFIPENLDLKTLLPKKRLKHIDKYHYFLHKIYEERVLNKMNDSRNGYVSLSAKAMQQALNTRQYTEVKQYLLQSNIIESDDIYSNGGEYQQYERKCYWFRLGTQYRDVQARQVMILDIEFEKKLTRIKNESISKVIEKTPHLQYMHFNLNDVRIDSESAFYKIGEMLNSNADYTLEQFQFDNHTIHKILNRDFFFKRDDNVNRVHHNVSNISKRIRSFLYIETGEALKNLDIRNSQPLLFSIVLKQYFQKELPSDVAEYISLCESGMFYEKMMQLLNIENTEANRKKFKKNFFGRIFYCEYNEHYQYKEAKLFEKHFPNCWSVICKEKEKNYKNLSTKMQQIESSIIIDGVIKHLASLRSDLFALSIHDSIVTTESNTAYVKQLMLAEFAKYEVYPTVNIEDL